MTGSDCTTIEPNLSEYALGLLDGDGSAAVAEHIDTCQRCRSEVAMLADAADTTLLLAPDAEPPADFEQRVLAAAARQTGGRGGRDRRRPVLVAVAFAVLAVALAAGDVWLYTRATGSPTETAIVRSARGEDVGRVVLSGDAPAWMFVSLQGSSVRGSYSCELVLDDGTVVRVGEFDSSGGRAEWSGPLDIDRARVREMRVVLPDGRVVARATF